MPVAKPVAGSRPATPSPLALPPSPPPRTAPARNLPAPIADTNFLVQTTPGPLPVNSEFAGEGIVSPLVQNRFRGPHQRSRKKVVLACVFVVVAGVLVLTFILLRDQLLGSKENHASGPGGSYNGEIRNLRNSQEKVFGVLGATSVWKLDSSLRSGLKAVLALQKTDADAWLAVGAKDFGTRKPRDAELVKEGKEHLENFFGETLELAEKTDTTELAGQTAQRLEFKGQIKQVFWQGECYLLMAAPTLEEAQQELTDLQRDNRGFVLIDERRGWREQPPTLDTFQGSKVPLALSAPEGVWEKKDPAEVDENGVLLLYGRYLKEKDNRKNSQVMVVAVEKQAKEALKSARAYFEDKKKEENKDYQLEPISDKAEGTLTAGKWKIPYVELRVQLGTQPTRYFLVAALDNAGQTIAILCDSTWESRQIWRQDFLDLLRMFQLKKK